MVDIFGKSRFRCAFSFVFRSANKPTTKNLDDTDYIRSCYLRLFVWSSHSKTFLNVFFFCSKIFPEPLVLFPMFSLFFSVRRRFLSLSFVHLSCIVCCQNKFFLFINSPQWSPFAVVFLSEGSLNSTNIFTTAKLSPPFMIKFGNELVPLRNQVWKQVFPLAVIFLSEGSLNTSTSFRKAKRTLFIINIGNNLI